MMLVVKNPPANAGRHKRLGFHLWIGKISWRRPQQPTPVFLPGENYGQRSLVGCSPWGRRESDTTNILCCPLLLLPSIFPSIRVFSNESILRIRWPHYWSFNFSLSPSKEYSGLISFRMDWLDLLAVQAALKSLFKHHSSKASILQHSIFFMIQLSPPYMTTGKTIAFTRRTFLGKVVSLLFNMLCRLVIAFLPRSKHL